MTPEERAAQNRKNAQSSTGPKTDQGKAISSQNAVKHGFFAKNDVISGEDLAAYEQHRQDIYDEFVPLTPTESVLTQRIASLTWRLMRADRLQTTTINTLVAAQQRATQPSKPPELNINAMIAQLRKKDKDPEYALNTAGIILAGLARYPNKPVTTDPTLDAAMNAAMNPPGSNHICDAEIQLGTVIYNDFHGSAVIERLQGYEQKIESSLFKTIRQFQQFQQARIKTDAARDKAGWARLRAEDEERKRHLDEEYQRKIRNEPNPNAPCHSERSRGTRKNTIAEGDPNQETIHYSQLTNHHCENEPNSDLTSISDITYNRYRQERAKREESNNPQNPPNHQ